MGNSITRKNEKLSTDVAKKLYYDAYKIHYEFNQFIEKNMKVNKHHISGGISSGISSSQSFTMDDFKIDIWYDISFMKLLRDRYNLLTKWVENFNIEKKEKRPKTLNLESYNFDNEEQKNAFLRRFMPIEEDLTLNDIAEVFKVPRNIPSIKKNKYIYQKLGTLFEKHGFTDSKKVIESLINLQNNLCTSGLDTFCEVLNKNSIDDFSKSDPTKKFYVRLNFTARRLSHIKIQEKIKDELKKKVKNQIIKPIQVILTEDMKEGDQIALSYEYVLSGVTTCKYFNWEIPKNFIDNHNIGEHVILEDKDLPFDLSIELFNIWYPEYSKELKKISKPPSLKEEYDISFDVNVGNEENNKMSQEIFIKLFNQSIDNFTVKINDHKINKGFDDYILSA